MLKVAEKLFDMDKPMHVLLFSPAKHEYKIEPFVNFMLDNLNRHLNSNDGDWQIIFCNQSEIKLEEKKEWLIKRRCEKIKEGRG